ncbi:L-rhamnose-H+ transport protein [Arachidicoccus rhizosphaerae]|uniref:L-rhamnose-H+ transport protein n=1 Tax=Arachidicoccus rhizosphaerae TaxID=551991 RepID=A0A1H3VNH6_9BACT|nr:L-rhamnose/proton symporter RhaT [Arachidicoccus rhizosphaerae]SDZ76320.1 L-rhamnose-H+ transport protein [Arachidicoccus rhizosphaerae]
MQLILGIIYHFLGGFASGSFYIPYKKVKGWAWESLWIAGGIFSWLIIPFLAAWLTIPNFTAIISHADSHTIAITYIFGVLWGIGGLTYGLGVRYLGVALGSTIILGLCSVFGSLIPSVYYNFYPSAGHDSFTDLLHTTWGQTVLIGILICVLGIIVCGKAGMLKDKDLQKDTELKKKEEYKIGLGLTVAIISGILSACFAFGIDAGKSMANEANDIWKLTHTGQGEFLFQNNVTYIIILLGGLTTNFIWCMALNARNKSFGDYTNKKTPLIKNYLFCALAGTTWFLQFFFYGMGESRMGNGPSSWILHMAFIILVANLWGLALKEWKGVTKKTYATIITGIALIIVSVLVVGYGNSLK